MIDLRPLQEKIQVARDYLQGYFEDSLDLFLKERFYFKFPDVGRADVYYRFDTPRIVLSYYLAFLPSGAMEWRGRRQSGARVATIKVERAVVKE